jgi:hypothetical protein
MGLRAELMEPYARVVAGRVTERKRVSLFTALQGKEHF